MKFKYAESFSLIELLIVLIILSLVISVFTPLITKKLKASDTTVGSFGSSQSSVLTRNVTKEDCDELNAVYVPKGINVEKPLCVMKYNAGDGYYNDDWTGVQKCIAGSSCTVQNGSSETVTKENLQPTCWVGTVSSVCTSDYGGYSGCTRTVCNWTGANRMCANIGWRLPTFEELTAFTNTAYSNSTLASNGLMFCGDTDASAGSSPRCRFLSGGCPGSYNGNCHPHDVWSGTLYSTAFAYDKYYDGAAWTDSRKIINQEASARCVLDSMEENIEESKEENECNCENGSCEDGVSFCTSCNDGWYLKNYKCISDDGLLYREPDSQKDCDPFNALYIPAEYNGTGGKGLCAVKYNAADRFMQWSINELEVGFVHASKTCDNYSNCCWWGQTNPSNDSSSRDPYGGYDAIWRALCGHTGANQLCSHWMPQGSPGRVWRLPNSAELAGWAAQINKETDKSNAVITKFLGDKGLELCDATNSDANAKCEGYDGRCLGSYQNVCRPFSVWSNTNIGTDRYAYMYYSGGKAYVVSDASNGYTYYTAAASARCVTDKVLK